MSDGAGVRRTLGRWDLVLLKIVAVVNINNVPPVAVYGWASVLLWILAFAAFFIPEGIAVFVMSRRYPGEGGIYLWTRKEFGDAHGFLSGWCYWANNLFYVPVLLVYMAGILSFAGGPHTAHLVTERWFVAGVAFGWLTIIAITNIRGLTLGKWIQNIGGVSTALSVGLVLLAGAAAWVTGKGMHPPKITGVNWGVGGSFAVMCNALVGIELASTMGDEIRNPRRDLPPAIMIAGGASLASYVLVTAAVLALVPLGGLGAIQGIMQAVSAGANNAGIPWIVPPVAVAMGVSVGGAASAWFAGSSRIPFVAGLDSALPRALGRVHPRWHSPYIALATCAGLAAVFTGISLTGSSVAEAYQVLLKASVIIQMIPFIYLFLGLAKLSGVSAGTRIAGALGLFTTIGALIAAFVPAPDVRSLLLFEGKLLVGVLVTVAIGCCLYWRARHSSVGSVVNDAKLPERS